MLNMGRRLYFDEQSRIKARRLADEKYRKNNKERLKQIRDKYRQTSQRYKEYQKLYEQSQKRLDYKRQYRRLDHVKKYHRDRMLWIRAVLLYRLGPRCIICGYDNDIRGLELDHIHNDGNVQRLKYGNEKKEYLHYIKNFDGVKNILQVLCGTCHRIKTLENVVYPMDDVMEYINRSDFNA